MLLFMPEEGGSTTELMCAVSWRRKTGWFATGHTLVKESLFCKVLYKCDGGTNVSWISKKENSHDLFILRLACLYYWLIFKLDVIGHPET